MTVFVKDIRRVVLLGAHPDDIEIGAGAFLLGLPAGIHVHYLLFTGSPERQAEARAAAKAFMPHVTLTFDLLDLPDGYLPCNWCAVKTALKAVAQIPADLVLAPSPDDAHQDHRLIGELTPTEFRRRATILHYELPKWDGDLGRPNIYVPVSEGDMRRKVALLNEHFPSQKSRDWWDEETFLALARIRGIECGQQYAEAFHNRKTVMALRPVVPGDLTALTAAGAPAHLH